MQLGDLIRRAAQHYAARPALTAGARTMSFAELDAATDRVGHDLLARGLVKGDRVAVLMPNGIDGVVVYYALAKAGLVRVPLNVRESEQDHLFKIGDAQARAFVGSALPEGASVDVTVNADEVGELTRRVDTPPPCRTEIGEDELYRLAYTGGTTGRPKGVMLTTRCELAEIRSFLVDLLPGLGPHSTMLHAAPVTHGSGAFLLPHLICGSRNVVLEKFTAGAFLELAERERATATFMVPTMIAMLLEEPNVADARLAMERLCYGGAPSPPALLERALGAVGPVLAQTYGQAEAPIAVTLLRPDEHTPERLASAGRPYTFVEMDVFDDDGRPVGHGELGEVVTRGEHVMEGYWRNEAATAEAFWPGGWLRTGDIGHVDGDGYLHLSDRRGDMIISGGFNVYPREVEDALVTHPAVIEAAVVGLPDQKWGERVAAAVVTRSEITPSELMSYCREHLAGYKRPRAIELWPELPKSPVGKSLRREVRDRMLSEGSQ
jgi:acyl-CoA synthetase (AMP-forming)/AMP-acid ligase II